LRAISEFAVHEQSAANTVTSLIDEWLNRENSDSPVYFCMPGFSASYQARLLRICFRNAFLAGGYENPRASVSKLKETADRKGLPPGLVGDLVDTIFGNT
jgi:hypothetical protein